MQANKARNLVIHNDEIMSRPVRSFIKKTVKDGMCHCHRLTDIFL